VESNVVHISLKLSIVSFKLLKYESILVNDRLMKAHYWA